MCRFNDINMIKRLAIGAAVALLACLTLFPGENNPASASPARLKWSIVNTPSEQGAVVLSPSEISAFVISSDDETFYAIDIPNSKVYKSIDAGVSWNDELTQALKNEGATLPAWVIAVAPNHPDLIAVVTDGRTEVYLSEDGGRSWQDAHVPDLGDMLIAAVAISPEYGEGERDIAIGTRNPVSTTTGDVWVRNLRGPNSWRAQGLNMDVSAVSFSPAYEVDKTILVVGSDDAGTYLCTGVRNTLENSTDWQGTSAAKVEITETTGSSPNKEQIITSDLALPSDYSVRDASKRIVYAAYSSETNADDVYRLEKDEVYRLNVNHGKKVAIASIAYYGTCKSGKLLVGEVLAKPNSSSAVVHFCSNPRDFFPKWTKPTKPPTGGAFSQRANAQVAWSSDGETAYCATGTNYLTNAAGWANVTVDGPWRGLERDESAFSRSQDGANTWNQISLIDTQMLRLCDFALSSDYKVLYLASVGGNFDSIWRSQSESLGETWERILCLSHRGDLILRHSPGTNALGKAIFLAVVDTDDARYSLDKGQTWKEVTDCPHITDLAIVNDEMFYILDDNLVHKCWWDDQLWGGTWDWRLNIDTGLRHGYRISISGSNFVFVSDAGDEGKVAYSTDGGASFRLTEAIPEPGKTKVIPDESFASNKFIYATTGICEIYRWAIGKSTSWQKLNPPCLGAFCDLAQTKGALYGIYGPGVARTLMAQSETVTAGDWDKLEMGLEGDIEFKCGTLRTIYNKETDSVDIWVIDDDEYLGGDISKYDHPEYRARGRLWVYTDAFITKTPWLTSPALGEFIPCDACTCQATSFCFRWNQLPSTLEYEVWIALDEDFSATLYKAKIAPFDCCNPAWCPATDDFHFACGNTYYWKVRSCTSLEGETIHSRWSPPMHFTVKACGAMEETHLTPILQAPANGSQNVSQMPGFSWIGFPGTTKYEFILAEDPAMSKVVARAEVPTTAYRYTNTLEWGKTYFWQVRALEPVPSEPAIATFTVATKPAPQFVPTPIRATPFWVWLLIAIFALLIVAIITLCLITRR